MKILKLLSGTMLNERIERFDEIANVSGLFFVWQSIIQGVKSFSSLSQLRSHHSGKLCLNLLPAVLLLEEMGYISFDGETIKNVKIPSDISCESEFISFFSDILLDFLLEEEVISLDCLIYNSQEDRFILSRKGIRYKYASYRNLLLSFGVLSKREDGNYHFEKRIDTITRIALLKNKKKTEKRLLEELERQRQEGLAGELFVLEYEKKRLNGHSSICKIKQVSLIDVTAGFDIISFDNLESKYLNRYIEVKTYKGKPHFHWSINEINVSRIRSEHYFLYLVNYDRIQDDGYSPEIIQNPSTYFVDNDEWISTPELFFYERISD